MRTIFNLNFTRLTGFEEYRRYFIEHIKKVIINYTYMKIIRVQVVLLGNINNNSVFRSISCMLDQQGK